MEFSRCCFKWKKQTETLKNALTDFINRQVLCDVTLISDGQVFKAHQFVLSACSPYFEKLFVEISSDKHPIICLLNVTHCQLRAILDFMYKGETIVPRDELPAFLKTCSELHVRGLSGDNCNDSDLEESMHQRDELGVQPKRRKTGTSKKCNKELYVEVSTPSTTFHSPKNEDHSKAKESRLGREQSVIRKSFPQHSSNTVASNTFFVQEDGSQTNTLNTPQNNTTMIEAVETLNQNLKLLQNQNITTNNNNNMPNILPHVNLMVKQPRNRNVLTEALDESVANRSQQPEEVIIRTLKAFQATEISDDNNEDTPRSMVFQMGDFNSPKKPVKNMNISESMVVHVDDNTQKDSDYDSDTILSPPRSFENKRNQNRSAIADKEKCKLNSTDKSMLIENDSNNTAIAKVYKNLDKEKGTTTEVNFNADVNKNPVRMNIFLGKTTPERKPSEKLLKGENKNKPSPSNTRSAKLRIPSQHSNITLSRNDSETSPSRVVKANQKQNGNDEPSTSGIQMSVLKPSSEKFENNDDDDSDSDSSIYISKVCSILDLPKSLRSSYCINCNRCVKQDLFKKHFREHSLKLSHMLALRRKERARTAKN